MQAMQRYQVFDWNIILMATMLVMTLIAVCIPMEQKMNTKVAMNLFHMGIAITELRWIQSLGKVIQVTTTRPKLFMLNLNHQQG